MPVRERWLCSAVNRSLAGPGGAIRDGFMAAATNSTTKVMLFDTALSEAQSL